MFTLHPDRCFPKVLLFTPPVPLPATLLVGGPATRHLLCRHFCSLLCQSLSICFSTLLGWLFYCPALSQCFTTAAFLCHPALLHCSALLHYYVPVLCFTAPMSSQLPNLNTSLSYSPQFPVQIIASYTCRLCCSLLQFLGASLHNILLLLPLHNAPPSTQMHFPAPWHCCAAPLC